MTAVQPTRSGRPDAAARPAAALAPAPAHRHRRALTDRLLAVWSVLVFALPVRADHRDRRLLVQHRPTARRVRPSSASTRSLTILRKSVLIADAVLVSLRTGADRRGDRDAARHARRHRDGPPPRQVGVRGSSGCCCSCRSPPRSSTPSRCCRGSCSSARTSGCRCSTTASCASSIGHSLFSIAVVVVHRARAARRPGREPRRGLRRPLRDAVPRRSAASRCRSRCRPCSPASCSRSRSASTTPSSPPFVQVSGSTPWPVYVLSAAALGPASRDRRGVDDHARCSPSSPSPSSPSCSSAPATPRPTSPAPWPAAEPSRRSRLDDERPPLRTDHRMPYADLVFTGGPVFTANTVRSRATAVAVGGGRIVAVGGDDVARPHRPAHRGRRPRRTDARARASRTRTCTRSRAGSTCCAATCARATTEAEYLDDRSRAYAAAHPDDEWILGGGWAMSAFPGGTPTAAALDARRARPPGVPRRTATATARGSTPRALRLAGIDRDTPDPADGRIERDADGAPDRHPARGRDGRSSTGCSPTSRSSDLHRGAAAPGSATCTRYGITGVAGRDRRRLRRRSPTRARLPARRGRRHADRPRRRRALVGPHRGARADPVARRAARALPRRPVRRDERQDHAGRRRRELHRRDARAVLRRTRALHRQLRHLVRRRRRSSTRPCRCSTPLGFQVHFHAIGDRAVRECLDAVEHAIAPQRPRRQPPPHRAHPGRAPRRRRRASASSASRRTCSRCGRRSSRRWSTSRCRSSATPRSAWQYPFGDLLRSGAVLAAGSDWSVSTPEPARRDPRRRQPQAAAGLRGGRVRRLPARAGDRPRDLAHRVHRRVGVGEPPRRRHRHDRGRQVRRPRRARPRSVRRPADEIGATRVLQTFVEGERVYARRLTARRPATDGRRIRHPRRDRSRREPRHRPREVIPVGTTVFERQRPAASVVAHSLDRTRHAVFWPDDLPGA